MKQTYNIETGPPALKWEEYCQIIEREWHRLLNSSSNISEKKIQNFLENNPCMVPGGQSMSGPSGHPAFPAALISQPKMPGFTARIPDFLWIATDSLHVYAVLIEIESPSKKMFTKLGKPTAKFTEALSQLTEWKVWLENTHNLNIFRDAYCPETSFPYKKFIPQYVLVYGRRSELEESPSLNSRRSEMQRANEYHMTFDRLHPIRDQDQYMTVRYSKHKYKAISIPATVELGPGLAKYRSLITGKSEVVMKTAYLSDERKAFLARRFKYWDEWVNSGAKGLRNLGDRE